MDIILDITIIFGYYDLFVITYSHIISQNPSYFDVITTEVPAQAETWHLLPALRSPLCGSVPVLKAPGGLWDVMPISVVMFVIRIYIYNYTY